MHWLRFLTLFLSSAFSLALPNMNKLEPKNSGAISGVLPNQLQGAEILDKAGSKIALDTKFHNDSGKEIILQEKFSNIDDKRPAIITMGYFECPMLCSLVLNGLVEGLNSLPFKLGKDYRIISVSIDEKDTWQIAKQKKINYLATLKNVDKPDWSFLVANAKESKKLADSLGFGFKKDEKTGQYAHAGGIFLVSSSGVISRVLYGISYTAADLKLSLLEASEGKIGSFLDKVLLTCFHYNPDSHKYGASIFAIVRLVSGLTVSLLALMIGYYLFLEKRRLRNG